MMPPAWHRGYPRTWGWWYWSLALDDWDQAKPYLVDVVLTGSGDTLLTIDGQEISPGGWWWGPVRVPRPVFPSRQ